MTKVDPYLFDARVVRHHIRRGTVTKEQYQAHLDSLEDEAEHGQEMVTRFTSPYEDRNYRASADASGDASKGQ